MTDLKRTLHQIQLPEKEEFFDAIRRHICQVLGFDYGFIDLVSGHEIVSVFSFSAEDGNDEAQKFIESLEDEYKQPLTATNTHIAQKVKQTQKPWVGKVYTNSKDTQGPDTKHTGTESGVDSEGYPYAIVPILENSTSEAWQVKGLIRVISFDAFREIDNKDLSTLKLMGEHLSARMQQFTALLHEQPGQTKTDLLDTDCILIVHSNRPIRRRFSRILTNSYQVIEADSGEKALAILRSAKVDLVLLDSEVQDTSGYAFCKVLKESPESKYMPVILVTSDTNPTAKVEGLNVGADDCLSESCMDAELLARARSSLRHRQAERELKVQLELLEDYAQRLEQTKEHLAVDKEQEKLRSRELERLKRESDFLRTQSDILRNQDAILHRISNTIRRSFNISENLQSMLEELAGWFNLDCCFVVLPSDNEPDDSIRCEYATHDEYKVRERDIDLATFRIFKQEFDKDELLIANDVPKDSRMVQFRETLDQLYVLSLFYVPITYEQKLLGLLAGYKCESEAKWNKDNEAFLKSVADQVAIGVINARLYARVQRQATTDGLTGLFNHRTGQEKLAEQLRLAERYQRNLAVAMIDVDHFKKINDTHGHPAGDTVLKTVARLIRRDCRDVDLPVRYGGEEFLLVLPEVNQEGAVVLAERLRRNLSQELIRHDDIEINVTASVGIAAFPEDAKNQQQLLDLADKALYLSKRLGRDQVHTASDLMFEEISSPEKREQEGSGQQESRSSTELDPERQEELVPEVVEMVKALASALYSKSEYNKVHHLETARLAELLAKVLGLSQQQVEQIRVAGLLHDVGTLSIPADLINKPGRYDTEERAIIEQHPYLGVQLLKPIRALKDICEILEHHHERWDGTGYPRGLKGDQIPLAARIVGVIDSYHAMISDRPYRKAMTQDEAIAELKVGAGSQWDPFLVDIFIAVLNSIRSNQSNNNQ